MMWSSVIGLIVVNVMGFVRSLALDRSFSKIEFLSSVVSIIVLIMVHVGI